METQLLEKLQDATRRFVWAIIYKANGDYSGEHMSLKQVLRILKLVVNELEQIITQGEID